MPADRLLVETDAPFLAPVPHRGKRNEPAWVTETLARCAIVADDALEATRATERRWHDSSRFRRSKRCELFALRTATPFAR